MLGRRCYRLSQVVYNHYQLLAVRSRGIEKFSRNTNSCHVLSEVREYTALLRTTVANLFFKSDQSVADTVCLCWLSRGVLFENNRCFDDPSQGAYGPAIIIFADEQQSTRVAWDYQASYWQISNHSFQKLRNPEMLKFGPLPNPTSRTLYRTDMHPGTLRPKESSRIFILKLPLDETLSELLCACYEYIMQLCDDLPSQSYFWNRIVRASHCAGILRCRHWSEPTHTFSVDFKICDFLKNYFLDSIFGRFSDFWNFKKNKICEITKIVAI